MAKMEAVYDALMTAGADYDLKPFGMLALDSMRLEKGYRSWKSDLTSDYTMLESGLGRWVKTDKDDFIGRTALMAEEQRGASRRFVAMVLDDPAEGDAFGEAIYLSSIRVQGADVGLIVSAGYGHRVGKSIAYGIVDEAAFANGNPQLEVEVLGRMRQAHIIDDGVLYDANNARVKA
jgi:dimethylglycine dehydrogenase